MDEKMKINSGSAVAFGISWLMEEGITQPNYDNGGRYKSHLLIERESKRSKMPQLSSENCELAISKNWTKSLMIQESEARNMFYQDNLTMNKTLRPLNHEKVKVMRESTVARLKS